MASFNLVLIISTIFLVKLISWKRINIKQKFKRIKIEEIMIFKKFKDNYHLIKFLIKVVTEKYQNKCKKKKIKIRFVILMIKKIQISKYKCNLKIKMTP